MRLLPGSALPAIPQAGEDEVQHEQHHQQRQEEHDRHVFVGDGSEGQNAAGESRQDGNDGADGDERWRQQVELLAQQVEQQEHGHHAQAEPHGPPAGTGFGEEGDFHGAPRFAESDGLIIL